MKTPHRPKYTERVERGLSLLVRDLIDGNSDYDLTDPNAPWIRRYKGKERKQVISAYKFISDAIYRLYVKDQARVPVAQLEEQRPSKTQVDGSSPSGDIADADTDKAKAT